MLTFMLGSISMVMVDLIATSSLVTGTATGGAVIVPTGLTNSPIELDWLTTTGLSAGQNRYMRVRITSELLADSVTGTNEDPRSFGGVSNGEVEDHYLLSDNVQYDGGDAPDTYLVRFADGGPIHPISTTLRLGTAATDGEDADGSLDAQLDDITATADEDGITLPILALGATSYTLDADVLNNTGSDADLIVWIDWDCNGTFDTSEAQIITATSNGVNTVYNPSWSGLTPTSRILFRACSFDADNRWLNWERIQAVRQLQVKWKTLE
ncbi:hypothetical protein ACVA6E_17700 [Photobacterium damselae]